MNRSIRLGVWVVLVSGGLAWSQAWSRAWSQDWPQWRGPNRDNKVVGFEAPKAWPKQLKEKWTKAVGEGVSSPVLAAGKIYVFGRIGGDEVTTCLDAADGSQIWQDKYATMTIKGAASGGGRFSGTRSTPAVADGKVCTLGATGAVTCFDAASGKIVWRVDTKSYPTFFTSSSPIITDGKCIVYVDGLTAFDMADGSVQWKWPGNKTPYGSPVLMTAGGVKQVVTPTQGAVAGVALADGKLLWKFDFGGTMYQSTYGTPIIDGATVIYGAPAGGKGGKDGGKGGKGGGSSTVAYTIEKKGDAFEAVELWNAPTGPYQYNTPVLRDGLLFGLSSKMNFYCMDAKSGKELWADTVARGETGGVLSAGPVILALSAGGQLVAFEPNGKEYKEVASYKLSPTPGYSYPIVSGNRVYVKGTTDLTLWTIE